MCGDADEYRNHEGELGEAGEGKKGVEVCQVVAEVRYSSLQKAIVKHHQKDLRPILMAPQRSPQPINTHSVGRAGLAQKVLDSIERVTTFPLCTF